MAGRRERIRIEGRELTLSNLEKPLWPEDGLTKGDYLAYLSRVAPLILPHLRDRPLVVTRYPDGAGTEGFYQKNVPQGTPAWVATEAIPSKERVIHYVLCQDLPTLLWLGNLACLELHPWPSRRWQRDYPDWLAFDLDPAEGASWQDVVAVAGLCRELLDHLDLEGFVKTTGATGLHIFVPVESRWTYKEITDLTGRFAEVIRRLDPDRVTLERIVARRQGKVYIDYLQNQQGKTLVGVYSPRPRAGAPVSFPVTWEELGAIRPDQFNLRTVPLLLAEYGDRFQGVLRKRQSLDEALRRVIREPAGTRR